MAVESCVLNMAAAHRLLARLVANMWEALGVLEVAGAMDRSLSGKTGSSRQIVGYQSDIWRI